MVFATWLLNYMIVMGKYMGSVKASTLRWPWHECGINDTIWHERMAAMMFFPLRLLRHCYGTK